MLKNRKYLAESFAAFKNSKKKEDPFDKEEETDDDDVEATDKEADDETDSEEDTDDATEEEVEEAEEDDELEAELKDELEEDDASDELEDLDGDGDVDEDDAEIADEEEAEEDEADDEQGASGIAVTATFGSNNDIASMLGGGMNALTGMTSFKRPEWAITRVMTDNGERIAMEYQNETECEVIVGNLTYTEADKRSTEIANQLNLIVFNSETDKYLGRVSSKVVRKQDGEKKTSYKY